MLGRFCFGLTAFAEDYFFEIPEKDNTKEEKLIWSGDFEAQYSLFHPQESSPIYRVKFADGTVFAFADFSDHKFKSNASGYACEVNLICVLEDLSLCKQISHRISLS